MTVIDVDSHFEASFIRDGNPLEKWADLLPTTAQYLTDMMTCDLARETPSSSVPSVEDLAVLMPPTNRSITHHLLSPDAGEPEFVVTSADERIRWLDRIGIDFALVNPGVYSTLPGYLGEHCADGMRCLNDFMADRLAGHTDRLMPVSLVDWCDLDRAIAELERMRARGSRAFWVRAEPLNSMSPAHPDWDRVWSAATDLGMVAILHIGNTPARFDGGWGDAGWELPGGGGLDGFYGYANSLRHQAGEMMLGGLVYGGVFGRHPTLTILTEELKIGWLPFFLARFEAFHRTASWPFDLTPSEMVRRNVRATPLPGLGDRDVIETLLPALPEILVFSSDYPHGEGNADPIELYEPGLSALEADLRNAFLGENMAECFARMGDPLALSV